MKDISLTAAKVAREEAEKAIGKATTEALRKYAEVTGLVVTGVRTTITTHRTVGQKSADLSIVQGVVLDTTAGDYL